MLQRTYPAVHMFTWSPSPLTFDLVTVLRVTRDTGSFLSTFGFPELFRVRSRHWTKIKGTQTNKRTDAV